MSDELSDYLRQRMDAEVERLVERLIAERNEARAEVERLEDRVDFAYREMDEMS